MSGSGKFHRSPDLQLCNARNRHATLSLDALQQMLCWLWRILVKPYEVPS